MINALLALLVATSPAADPGPGAGATSDDIPNIVVVATRSARPVLDVAASVTVIDEQQIADELSTSPLDLVRYQPAISVPRTGTRFGAGGYTIRGIGGNRVAIEVDGVPVADQFDIGSHANAERDLVDVDLIDRIEILRGPASTLYGSDAIGGVVAYSTLDPADLGDGRWRLRSSYRDDDASVSTSVMTAMTGPRIGGLLSLTHREGDQLDAAALTGVADQRSYRSNALFGKLTLDTAESGSVVAVVDHYQRDVDSDIRSVLGQGRFRSTTLLTGDDAQQRDRFSLAWSHELEQSWAEQVRVLGYYQRSVTEQATLEQRASQNLQRDRLFDYRQRVTGLKADFGTNTDWLGARHQIGYGLDLKQTKTTEFRDGLQTDLAGGSPSNRMLGEVFPVRDFPLSKTNELGVYLHDEIKRPGSRWSFIPALRADYYELEPSIDAVFAADHPEQPLVGLTETSWSPKLGVLYQPANDRSWYAQYARGFRAPPFEDANIGLDIPLFNIRAIPNPLLKAEVSDTYEVGWRLHGESTKLDLAAHYSDYRDFIETKVRLGPDPATGVVLFQSQNIQSAYIYGIELRLTQQLDQIGHQLDNLTLDLALAWARGHNDETNQALSSVDPAELTAGLHWRAPDWPLTATLRGTVVDRKRDIDDSEQFIPDRYAVFDLLAQYRLGPSATLRAGLFNFTDQTYWRWANVRGLGSDDPLIDQLSAPGRSAGLSISLTW